jgi:hypothetical protein
MHVLALLPQPSLPNSLSLPSTVLSICDDILSAQVTLSSVRELSMKILRVEQQIPRTPPVLLPTLLSFLFGLLQVKMTLLWTPARSAIIAFAQRHFMIFWPEALTRLRCYVFPPSDSSAADVDMPDISDALQSAFEEAKRQYAATESATPSAICAQLWKVLAALGEKVESEVATEFCEFFVSFLSRAYCLDVQGLTPLPATGTYPIRCLPSGHADYLILLFRKSPLAQEPEGAAAGVSRRMGAV